MCCTKHCGLAYAGPARARRKLASQLARLLYRTAKMKDLDQSDLRYVLSLSRSGRMAAAARKLGVDHSTFSRRIALIESRLGVRLFERKAGVLKPTQPGRILVLRAESIELKLEAVTDKATGARQA